MTSGYGWPLALERRGLLGFRVRYSPDQNRPSRGRARRHSPDAQGTAGLDARDRLRFARRHRGEVDRLGRRDLARRHPANRHDTVDLHARGRCAVGRRHTTDLRDLRGDRLERGHCCVRVERAHWPRRLAGLDVDRPSPHFAQHPLALSRRRQSLQPIDEGAQPPEPMVAAHVP